MVAGAQISLMRDFFPVHYNYLSRGTFRGVTAATTGPRMLIDTALPCLVYRTHLPSSAHSQRIGSTLVLHQFVVAPAKRVRAIIPDATVNRPVSVASEKALHANM